MAVVYKAQDLVLRRLVAIKLLQEGLTSDEEFVRSFQKEAHAAASLAHPNIVTVHDVGQDQHHHFIVMEYVDGQTLKSLIRERQGAGLPISINRALDLAIQICSGIGYAHRAGLVHCDVKPQNILVTRDERVKVADFGIARAMSEASVQISDLVWGTPQYFSPEQAAGKKATPASDVYSIGVILFELLTGRLPFAAETHTALALMHLMEPPPAVARLNPAVPPQLEQLIGKVLAKEPAGRYRTAGQFGRVLAAYRQSSQQETGPVKPLGDQPVLPAQTTAVFEQHTAVYEPPAFKRPATARTVRRPAASPPEAIHIPVPVTAGADWRAISLGLLALVALLGLIPLWYFVYLAWVG